LERRIIFISKSLQTLAIGLMGLEGAGYGANAMEIAPRYAGIIFGVSNTVATIPGIVGVAITGVILDYTQSWCIVFLLSGFICAVAAVVWLLFAKAEAIIH